MEIQLHSRFLLKKTYNTLVCKHPKESIVPVTTPAASSALFQGLQPHIEKMQELSLGVNDQENIC